MNKKKIGAFFDPFFDFLKIRKISNVQRQKAPKNFQNDFLPMGGGLKYQKRIKTQLLRSTGPRKLQKRKYKSLNEFRGQNDPPPWSINTHFLTLLFVFTEFIVFISAVNKKCLTPPPLSTKHQICKSLNLKVSTLVTKHFGCRSRTKRRLA